MQISGPTSPHSLRLHFTSATERQSLLTSLSPGQDLEARVLDGLSAGRWAIRLMGRTLVAESHLPLVPGQLVEARVDSVGPPLVLTVTGGTGSEVASIGRALQELGLLDDPLNRSIAKGLIGRGMPVDRQGVLSLRDLLGGLPLPADDPDALEELVLKALFLRERGLPVTPDTLAAYLGRLPGGTMGGLLEGLVAFLRELRLTKSPVSDIGTLADRIHNLLTDGGGLSGDGLARLVAGLGLDLEGRLASWIAGGGDGLPEGLGEAIKTALLRLQAQLTSLDAAGPDRSALEALQGRLRAVLSFLDTLQADNLPHPGRESLQLQIPILFEGQFRTADLRVTGRSADGARRVDPDDLRLSLAIDLSGIGPLRIDLAVVKGTATCGLHAADEERAAFLQTFTGELKAALESCGYRISEIGCRVFSGLPSDDRDGGTPSVGLDLRV